MSKQFILLMALLLAGIAAILFALTDEETYSALAPYPNNSILLWLNP